MPLQNRVRPDGEIVAAPSRGTMMGNRGGCFHTANRTLKARKFGTKQWICCVLDFKNRRRILMNPGRYTELFFLDEATALSAGHRPCFECRRTDAEHFADVWQKRTSAISRPRAPEMDNILHAERIETKSGLKKTFSAHPKNLPDHTFVQFNGAPHILLRGRLHLWTSAEYLPVIQSIPDHALVVLTPATTVAQLAAGYTPGLHPSLTATLT